MSRGEGWLTFIRRTHIPTVKPHLFTVINPAAGHGRCGKLVGRVLNTLRRAGVELDVVETQYSGHAIELVKDAYGLGRRNFLAVGGDGTSCEVVNGLFPGALADAPPTLAMLPLGTGNNFLRDFTDEVLDHAITSIIEGRTRPCDVMRLTHREGVVHYINLLSVGFPARVTDFANRRLKTLGPLGYWLAILLCLFNLEQRTFPLRLDEQPEIDRSPYLLLSFNNSKYTGAKMMLAPHASASDGLIELVSVRPMGRLEFISNLPSLRNGSHMTHPLISGRAARRVEFHLDGPVITMVDGEVYALHCETLEVLPAALRVVA